MVASNDAGRDVPPGLPGRIFAGLVADGEVLM
jgi:hypothetical protein